MGQFLRGIVVGMAIMGVAGVSAAGIEVRLKDGSTWRGEVSTPVEVTFAERGQPVTLKGRVVDAGQWHVVLEVELAGELRNKTIFKGDIVAMKTVEAAAAPAAEKSATKRGEPKADGPADIDQPGVFVLPLRNTVGIYMRHEEMEKIAEHADQWGPGQIIVLMIDSPGGLVTETETIHATLTEIKKRHRLVAWIREAISAACATALHCDEIYFMTEGSAGAMTAFAGGKAWEGEQLEEWLRRAGDWAESGGHSRYIAEAMIHAPKLLSYDKNPETGEVTFRNDLSGDVILSRENENLVFTASQAVDCGFADGIADTEEELAKLLDLPRWHEKSPYGRQIATEWYELVEQANEELPKLRARYSFVGTGSGDQVVILQQRIQVLKDLVRWWDRCPNATEMSGIPPKEQLEREIRQLQHELGEIKKQRREY